MATNDEQGMKEEQRQFLKELAELTKKYGIVISGCGCCGSPSLEQTSDDGKYYADGFDSEGNALTITYMTLDKKLEMENRPGIKFYEQFIIKLSVKVSEIS